MGFVDFSGSGTKSWLPARGSHGLVLALEQVPQWAALNQALLRISAPCLKRRFSCTPFLEHRDGALQDGLGSTTATAATGRSLLSHR